MRKDTETPVAVPPAAVNRHLLFTGPGEVRLVEGPVEAPGPGGLLLRTRRTLISTGTELAHLAGPPWTNPGGRALPAYPHVPGYSNAGAVVAAGPGVTAWRSGDRVVSAAPHAAYPLLQTPPPGTAGEELAGTHWVIPIPDAVSDEEAAFCTLATSVLHGCRVGAPQLGEDAVVIGQGLLGQLLVQYLRLAGCRTVIAVDLAAARLAITGRVGAATHRLNPAAEDVVAAVRDLTEGRGADVVYESTGRTATYDLAFALARFHGRVVGLGSPRWPAPVDMHEAHMKALRVLGAIVWSHPPEDSRENRWSRRANGHLVMELLARRQLNVRDLITHRVPAMEAPAVYAQLLAHREAFLGIILEW